MGDEARVLIVDDEAPLAELYADWLRSDYAVETAYSGEEALEKVGADTDIVLLDRRMPGLSGDEVLEEIHDRDIECRVAMVTAVDPDFDILEMPFDHYVTKSVAMDELRNVVDRLQRLAEFDQRMQRYFSLASKRAALEAEKPPAELRSSDEYDALIAELETLQDELDDMIDTLDQRDIATLLSEI